MSTSTSTTASSNSSAVSTPSLLLLDASPRGERSHSRRLAQEYLTTWQAAHPTGTAVTRDLGHEPPPFVNEAWVEGAFTPAEGHSTAARRDLGYEPKISMTTGTAELVARHRARKTPA